MADTLPFNKTVLPSGTRLILVPMKGINSIATSVMVGVGSRYETSKINGISHFLEHMVFKGTETYPTTDDVNIIERYGGLQNAYTDIDITNYHNKTLSTDWNIALEINKELALRPRLEQKYIEKERNVILEEMKRYDDEPANKAEETFHTMLYPKTTLGMKVIGEPASLKSVEAKELRAYHDRWYRLENMVVVVAGKIENSQSSRISRQVETWFGANRSPAATTQPKANDYDTVKEAQAKPAIEVVTKKEAQQAHMVLGLRTFGRTSQDRFAWSVFNLLMGVSFSSRLFREIREKRGLCYHIRSSSSTYQDVGYWSIYAGVGTDKVGEATEAIMEQLQEVKAKGVTDDELIVSKKRLKTMIAFRAEDPEFQNEYYGRQELFALPVMTLDDYLQKIDRVTKNDVDRLVNKYFVTHNLNMAIVWSKKRESKLNRVLSL